MQFEQNSAVSPCCIYHPVPLDHRTASRRCPLCSPGRSGRLRLPCSHLPAPAPQQTPSSGSRTWTMQSLCVQCQHALREAHALRQDFLFVNICSCPTFTLKPSRTKAGKPTGAAFCCCIRVFSSRAWSQTCRWHCMTVIRNFAHVRWHYCMATAGAVQPKTKEKSSHRANFCCNASTVAD